MQVTAYVALGTNLGDLKENLDGALQRLREKGLDGAQFGPSFAVSMRLRRFLRLFQEDFTGGATRRTCAVWRPSSSRS